MYDYYGIKSFKVYRDAESVKLFECETAQDPKTQEFDFLEI